MVDMDTWQIVIDAILALAAIATFLYAWLNERRRRKEERALVKLNARLVNISTYGNTRMVLLNVANRHFMPINITGLDVILPGTYCEAFINIPNESAPMRLPGTIGSFEATWTFWVERDLVMDLIKTISNPMEPVKWLPRRLHLNRLYAIKNRLSIRIWGRIKVRFLVKTSILEDYQSNTLRIRLKPYRVDVRSSRERPTNRTLKTS